MKKTLAAVGKAILYVLALFLIQIIVIFGYLIVSGADIMDSPIIRDVPSRNAAAAGGAFRL